ncbi:hypothetical protein [Streptomyces sp. NPDC051546]|uniref:hypothetical protein n=1 Tax=Streptomyces sp. NPDC051546 TaxID=3365655 RepID=UPI00379FDA91
MADVPEKAPIRNAYAQRFADDLDANRMEQAVVTEEIDALGKRLEQLRFDEAWLAQAQSSLAVVVAPSDSDSSADVGAQSAEEGHQAGVSVSAGARFDEPQAVPRPRRARLVKAADPKSAGKRVAAAKGRTTAKKATTRKNPVEVADATAEEKTVRQVSALGKSAGKEKGGPTLHELIVEILLKTPGAPYVAREVTEQLAQDHPGRATSVQTVRNNLEGLVKKGAVEKSLQQGSAMYIAHATAESPAIAADTIVGDPDRAVVEVAEKELAEA